MTTAVAALCAAPAWASSPHPNPDANGVDLTLGTFDLQLPVATIGAGQAELTLVALDTEADNWSSVQLSQSAFNGVTHHMVRMGHRTDTFTSANPYSIQGSGATFDGTTYRTLDGTEILFGNPAGSQGGTSNLCDANNGTDCSLLPMSIVRQNGLAVSFSWDVQTACDRMLSAEGPAPNCTSSWRLERVENSAGYAMVWNYASSDWYRRTSVALKSGETTLGTVGYANPSAGVYTITTPGGRVWTLRGSRHVVNAVRRPGASADTTVVTRGASGHVSAVTRDGVTTNYSRSVSGSIATLVVTDALGGATTVVSDLAKYRPVSMTDPLGRVTAMAYDALGRPTEVTYPAGDKVQFAYDARGNLIEQRRKAKPSVGGADIVTSTGFAASCDTPSCNSPLWTRDANGAQTDYGYDPDSGLLTRVTGPAPAAGGDRPQTRLTYTDVAGVQVVTGVSTCRSGSAPDCVGTAQETRRTLSYDAALNPVSVAVAAGDGSLAASETFSYDLVGNLVARDGPLAGAEDTTRWRWSADREPLGTIGPDPDGAGALPRPATRISYTAGGQVASVAAGTVAGTSDADWANFTVSREAATGYDANARPVTQALVAGGTTHSLAQASYDALGRLECAATRMNPGAFGALPASACTLGTPASFGPDRIARTTYDAAGQVVKTTSALGTADQSDDATAVYTANGLVAQVIDAEGNRTSYGYDGFDRLVRVELPVATKGAGASDAGNYETYSYDAAGNVLTRRKRDGRVLGFAYDALNRLTVKTVPDGGGLPAAATRDVYYGYDLAGRLAYARFESATGEGVSASYDALGRLASSTSTMGGTARTLAYQYDAAGNRTRVTHPDGVYFDYAYDAAGRWTNSQWWTPAMGTVPFVAVSYDGLGRRADVNRASSYTGYNVNAAGRLLNQDQRFAGGVGSTTTTFGYNPAGQITSRTSGNPDYAWTGHVNVDRAYASNGLNQYTSAGSASFGYDTNGNLTGDGTSSFTYDAENRLVSASNGTSLGYDPLGRLDTVTRNGAATRFLHDGDRLAVEYDGSGAIGRRYMFGPDGNEPIVEDAGGAMNCTGTRFLHPDERGSIVAAADCHGNRTGVNSYDDYGIPAASNAGRFQYTGQAYLAELGLYYYKARMYSPTLGRFLQTDPIGYADGLNWYAYVGNDPVNAIDPSGLACVNGVDETGTSCGEVTVTARSSQSGIGFGGGGWFGSSGNGRYVWNLSTDIGDAAMVAGGEPQNNCPRTASPSAWQEIGGVGLGVGDALSFGLYSEAISLIPGNDVAGQRGTSGYDVSLTVAGAIGGLRLAYAGVAKAFSLFDGRTAVAARNGLKGIMSGLGSAHPRIKSYDQLLSKYGSDKAVAAAAGRTNPAVNTAGAGVAGSSASAALRCQ